MKFSDWTLLRELAAAMKCERQVRDGWYVRSCYASDARDCCVSCRLLRRLEHRLNA